MNENMFKNFKFTKNQGLTNEEISLIEKRNNWIIPDFYKQILNYSNGIETGDVNLFGSNYIEEFNKIEEFEEYTPGYIGIGGTGGGYILAMEQKSDANVIYVFGSGANFVGEEVLKVENIEKWFLNCCPIDQGVKIY